MPCNGYHAVFQYVNTQLRRCGSKKLGYTSFDSGVYRIESQTLFLFNDLYVIIDSATVAIPVHNIII